MCAAKMVRFIKKCLRGDESTIQSDLLTNGPTADGVFTVPSTAGSSSIQSGRRAPRTSGRTEKSQRKNRGLPDVLQSRNIVSVNASSYSEDSFGPLLDVMSYESFQSQPDIYLDSKGSDLSRHLAYRAHSQPHHRNHSRTNLQHLTFRQLSPFSRSAVESTDSKPFSQKHLHHLFPVSVQRSTDGEGGEEKQQRSPILCESGGMKCPPPNRTLVS